MDLQALWQELDRLKNESRSLQQSISRLEETIRAQAGATKTSQMPAAIPAGVPVRKDDLGAKPQRDLETAIGVRWLVVTGVIALVIALGYEVRMAIQQGWINEEVRCAAAALLGLVLFGLGARLRESYPRYGEVLMSGGVVAVLISIYASYYLYHLIRGPAAVFFIVGVAFASAFASWKVKATTPLYIGLLGSYFAPMLVETVGASLPAFFLFLTILNLSYLILARTIRLLPLHVLALYAATLLYCFAWYRRFHESPLEWQWAFFYQIFQAFCFGVASIIPALLDDEPLSTENTWALFPAILLFYYLGGDLLLRYAEVWHFFFAVATALFLVVLTQIGRAGLKIKMHHHEPSVMVTLVSLLIGSHLIVHHLDRIVETWGLFVWFYLSVFLWNYFLKPKSLGFMLLVFALFMLIRLNFNFGYARAESITPFFNSQFLLLAVLSGSFFYGAKVFADHKDNTRLLLLVAHVQMLRAFYLQVEAWKLQSFAPFVTTLFWVIYAGAVLMCGMVQQKQAMRISALWIFALCTLKVFLYDTASTSAMVKTFSYFVLGVALILAGYWYQRGKAKAA